MAGRKKKTGTRVQGTRVRRQSRPRSPIKFEVTRNFVRERLLDPATCIQGSYLTITHDNHPTTPKGVKIVTCMARGMNKRTAQAILHSKSRFAKHHPEAWAMLRGKKTLTREELLASPAYRAKEHKEFLGAASFAGMFGLDFPNQAALVQHLISSGWLEQQAAMKRAKSRIKRERAAMRRGHMPRARNPGRGLSAMDFKDDASVLAWLHMTGPKGYDGFGSMFDK